MANTKRQTRERAKVVWKFVLLMLVYQFVDFVNVEQTVAIVPHSYYERPETNFDSTFDSIFENGSVSIDISDSKFKEDSVSIDIKNDSKSLK